MAGGRLSKNRFNFSFNILLALCFAVVLLFFFFTYDQAGTSSVDNNHYADIVICFAFVFCGVAWLFLKKLNLFNSKTLVALIMICGFALRLSYAIRYGYNQHQHDVESLQSFGHLSYINTLAFDGALPQINDWQFSHPPLHHFLAALVVRFSDALGFSLNRAFENVQLLTVFYSSITMLVGVKILERCNIKGNALLFCSLLLSFHPTFTILAGSINNDILTILLSMCAVYCLIIWYQGPSVKLAVICGLFCGLAMMTKVSAALIAVVIAISVIIKKASSKQFGFKCFWVQTAMFLLVFLPLGLWHPIRNYILFDQPLGYVAPISTDSQLFIGDYSVFERLFSLFSNDGVGVYVNVWEEYNLPTYILRNSLFGEYSFGNYGVALFAIIANAVLILSTLISVVILIIKRYNGYSNIIPLTVLFFIQIAFFVYFNIKYPFGCSMDFRYIVPTLFSGIVFLGAVMNDEHSSSSVAIKCLSLTIKFAATVLCISSVVIML